METSDITVEILRAIREEAAQTNLRIDNLGTRIDATNERIDATNERIDLTHQRLGHLEVFLATEIIGLRNEFVAARDMLVGHGTLRHRMDRAEADIADIKKRLT